MKGKSLRATHPSDDKGDGMTCRLKTKKQKAILIIPVVCILLIGWVLRFVYLNTQWPAPAIQVVPMGDSVQIGTLTYRVIDTKLGTDHEVAQYFNPEVDLSELAAAPNMKEYGWTQLILGVNVEISNTGNTAEALDVVTFSLEYNEWYTNADFYAAHLYNDSKKSSIMIGAQDTVTYVFPFNIYKEHLSESYWNDVNTLAFYIPFFSYPDKVQMMVTE